MRAIATIVANHVVLSIQSPCPGKRPRSQSTPQYHARVAHDALGLVLVSRRVRRIRPACNQLPTATAGSGAVGRVAHLNRAPIYALLIRFDQEGHAVGPPIQLVVGNTHDRSFLTGCTDTRCIAGYVTDTGDQRLYLLELSELAQQSEPEPAWPATCGS